MLYYFGKMFDGINLNNLYSWFYLFKLLKKGYSSLMNKKLKLSFFTGPKEMKLRSNQRINTSMY